MSIKIRQKGAAYSINLDEEEWNFPDRKTMEASLKTMLDWKDKYGKIREK